MKTLSNNFFLITSISLAILYYIFLLIFSLDTIDSGFILSFVGRLKAEQTIYKDFDYVRPFGSPLLWELICYPISFKNPYLFIIIRAIVIFQVFIISYLVIKLIEPQTKKNETILLILLSNILFLHSFNIMPWHTIDGIFFAIISIFSTHKKYYLSAIILALFAASTKQSFYLFFIIFIIINFILITRNIKNIKTPDIIISITLLIISVILITKKEIFSSLPDFLKQTQTENSIYHFINQAFYSYFPKDFKETAFYLAILSLLIYINVFKKNSIFLFFLILSISVFVSPLLNMGNYLGDKILFICLGIQSLFFSNNNKKILLSLLLLGWASSISWGYNTPIFLIPSILITLFYTKKHFEYLKFALIFSVFLFFSIRVIYPYFSDSPLETRFIKVKDINAISGIYMSEKNYNYYKESNELYQKYKKVVFLPGNPIADIINNDFPGRASWEMDVEYPNWKNDKSINNFIIVDKNPTINYDKGFFKSSITNYLLKNKTKIDSTKYFYIYK